MNNETDLEGNRNLNVSYDKLAIKIQPTDSLNAPNGPFTVGVGKTRLGTNFNFVNNILTFTNEGTTYTVTFTPK